MEDFLGPFVKQFKKDDEVIIGQKSCSSATRDLDLTGSILASLPRDIGKLIALERLILDGSKNAVFRVFKLEIDELKFEVKNAQLEEEDLDSCSIQVMESRVTDMESRATDIQLRTQRLEDFGSRVECYRDYYNDDKKLKLKLSLLPPEIGKLKALKELCLPNNCLVSLPPEIGSLGALQKLDLTNNRLTSLPAEIGQLSTLEMLILKRNLLTSVPPEIGNLGSLKFLCLSNNQLTLLLPEIGKLEALEVLALDPRVIPSEIRNGYSTFSDELYKSCAKHVRRLWLEQNPWSEQNHRFYPLPTRKAILTVLMIASFQNDNPRHPEATFYKLPTEMLYYMFHFF